MDLRVLAVIALLFSGVCASNGMDETGGGEAEEDGFEATQLILISPNGSSSYGVKNAVSILKDVSFNQSLPTVFFIHGFRDNRNSDSVTLVTKAFVRNGSHNVIAVDWSAYNSIPYLSAFENMRGVGRTVGDALNRMVKAGLPSSGIWLVGHSLGAQMTAILSRTAMFDVQKITGLDPALPGFKVPGGTRLTRDAARLVEVVHTDSGVFGFDESCGDIDIWPNGGTAVQPGCLFSLEDEPGCSHTRSYRYFAESVENSLNFPAVKCSSWFHFRRGACPINDTNVVFLGQNQPGQNNTGNYFLTTNRSSPYGRGLQGVAGSD